MTLLIDLILVILISVCIFYSYILSKRIEELQASKEEFRRIVKYFDAAISKADDSIGELSKLSTTATEQISTAINKAESLTSDLKFMNEVGSNIADKLEKNMQEARVVNSGFNNRASEDEFDNKDLDHKNHLNPLIKSFSSIKSSEPTTGISYYDTLRKLGLKK